MNRSDNPWIVIPRPRPAARLRLYCFAYAGGSASIFHNWHRALPENVEVRAVQYPGRENRWGEPAISEAGELAGGITDGIQAELSEKPFAFFGHSLGAVLAYEVVRQLLTLGNAEPVHLFLSGRRAPHFEPSPPLLGGLPDDEFIFQLGKLNGTPREVLQDLELMGLLLPMLRADFAQDETYEWLPGVTLHQNFSIFGGDADLKVPQNQLEAWAEYTTGSSTLTLFPGGHFYMKDPESGLFPAMRLELSHLVAYGRE